MNYYDQIKGLLISNEIYKRVKDYSKNKSDVETYYNVGKLIIEAQGGEKRAKYGDGLIKEYSQKLIIELNNKKYSYRNLMNMRKFYLLFRNRKVNALRSQLSWSHYRELLSIKNPNEIIYYINLAISNSLGYRELRARIKNKEYERLPIETKNKLIKSRELKVNDLIPNPIVIKSNMLKEKISEYTLKQVLLNSIDDFLRQLGMGFTYVGSEYKIKIGDRYNYIDLLLFNIKFNCYVVVELKVTEFKVEYISQVQKYMNYIDKNIKEISNNNTIGIIICKRENKFVIEYCSDERITIRKYELV